MLRNIQDRAERPDTQITNTYMCLETNTNVFRHIRISEWNSLSVGIGIENKTAEFWGKR